MASILDPYQGGTGTGIVPTTGQIPYSPAGSNYTPTNILGLVDRLTSVTTTAGDTLIHTSDGTNEQLQWSRSAAQLKFTDSTGTDVIRLYASNDTTAAGLFVNGHLHAGRGTSLISSRPQVNYLMSIAEDTADTWDSLGLTGGFQTALQIQPQLNADAAQLYQAYTLADLSYRLNAGFDSTDGAGGGLATTLTGAKFSIASSMTAPLVGSLSTISMADFSVNFSLQGTPTAVTELTGIRISTLSITNPVPTRTISIKSTATLGGTTSWGGMVIGDWQMNTTGRFYLGGTLTTKGINWISRGPGATEIIIGNNSDFEYSIFNNSFGPYSAGGSTAKTLGTATTLGWAGLYLQDTAASFTTLLQATNTGISANNTLTLNLQNSSKTLTLSGNLTAGDWLDQSVKTTASPTFANTRINGGLGMGVAAPTLTWIQIAAGATGYSQIQLASSTAPSSPVAGDIWYDGTYSSFWSGLAIKDSAANYLLQLKATGTSVAADRVLTLDTNNANRTISLKGDIATGTYTPTRSAEANMDANVTMTQAQYMRVGDMVTVSGRFNANPTLTATATSFEITLPVASNIGAVEDCAGTAFCGSIASQGAEIIGVVANDTAKIQWVATDVTAQDWAYQFTYQII